MSIFDSIKKSVDKTIESAHEAGDPKAGGGVAGFWGGKGDIEGILEAKAAKMGGEFNWQTSIVDLFKVLELDPSLDNRKQLAGELGYDGARDGSAEMNIWLHKATMAKLEANGAQVPDSLKG